MANTDTTRNKIKAKISAIKKISDNPKSLIDNVYDAYGDKLDSTSGIIKKSVTNFTSKLKGGTRNYKDIFGEIIDIGESFLGNEKEDPINPKTEALEKSKILRYAKEASRKTLQVGKQIINNETKKKFFGSTGICDSTVTLGSNSLLISPREFDFVNMLKVDPTSVTGKLMYESEIPNVTDDIKFNKVLYNTFNTTDPYYFRSKEGTVLFNLTWNSAEQKYAINELSSTTRIGYFLDGYYNSIEFPDIEHIFKTAMHMVLGGSPTEPKPFKEGTKDMNRLLQKLFSICGKPSTNKPLLTTTDTELTEDEIDTQTYFDFDDIEGIDLDEENDTLNGVLKFRDCNNFEVEINPNYSEDFSYLLDKKPIEENIMNTLNKAAIDAYEEAESELKVQGFKYSLITKYILKIPRALISSMLSPKMFFPIAVVYKILKGVILTAKELMAELYNLFFNIVKKLFWKFIREFWGFIKRDLLVFVKKIAAKIIMNKLKKIKMIIQILINIIKKVLETTIGSCSDIFNAILQTITTALNAPIKIPIPGLLLLFSQFLPGFSNDRAYMNIVERLEVSGINMGPIYGSENKLPLLIKGIVDGYTEELDTNSYVKVSIKGASIASFSIPPGILEGYGKLM